MAAAVVHLPELLGECMSCREYDAELRDSGGVRIEGLGRGHTVNLDPGPTIYLCSKCAMKIAVTILEQLVMG